jgi:hypothetical protein
VSASGLTPSLLHYNDNDFVLSTMLIPSVITFTEVTAYDDTKGPKINVNQKILKAEI